MRNSSGKKLWIFKTNQLHKDKRVIRKLMLFHCSLELMLLLADETEQAQVGTKQLHRFDLYLSGEHTFILQSIKKRW